MKRNLQVVALLVALAASVFSLTGITSAAKGTVATKPAAQTALSPIPITGTFTGPGPKGTGTIKGTFTPQNFAADSNGKLVLVGTLSGTAIDSNGNTVKQFNNRTVQLPVSLAGTSSTATPNSQPGTTTGQGHSTAAAMVGAACPVLNLVLGPLNLNLLGLQITLNQVNLNISAIPGAGNLLGNLLCDVANLLNTPNLPASALANLLNGILGLLGTL